jgi:Leucine-rich repeat (LRR) protein
MKALRFLDLRENKLTCLPTNIRFLPNLEKLDVRWNKELVIPDWFQELEQRGCTVFY